jgi:Nucleotidyl transferase AbiEii toxin, Type IV TA system
MGTDNLQLHCLPAAQRRLWDELGNVPPEFVLCGGTALALLLGHRRSIDYDFFSYQDIDAQQLKATIPFLTDAEVLQEEPNTLTVAVKRGKPVLVSFFGVPKMQRIKSTRPLRQPRIGLASPIDLAGMKAAVVTQRVEIKDYLDLHAIFTQTSLTILDALAAATKIYGQQFNPMLGLKAIGDLNASELTKLPQSIKRALRRVVGEVDLKTLAQDLKTRKLTARCRLSPIRQPSR